LTHPNIAAVFDTRNRGDQPYIVMELINGEPLSDKLLAGSLPLPEAVRIVSLMRSAWRSSPPGVVHAILSIERCDHRARSGKVLDFGLVKQLYEQHSSRRS